MSQDTTNLILIIFAFVAIVGNVIAFLFTRVELMAQRKETKALTILTSDLEHKVHRLATKLGHKIQRLERLRELISNLLRITIGLRQTGRPLPEFFDFWLQREMIVPEFHALIQTINDEKLTTLGLQLTDTLSKDIWRKTGYETDFDTDEFRKVYMLLRGYTQVMYQRILELMEEATQQDE